MKLWFYGCASALALAAGPPAHAQVTPSAAESLEEIVVTARKREESLQNVPASVQVVGERQIAALNASSLADLNGTTPNASINPTSGLITIRGISSSVRNAGFEAGAAVYIDEVYQGRPAGNNQDLVDIERVEILRGPQGTLYGKNTTAGAFSITTVGPGADWRGRGFVRLGEDDERSIAGYVAGPLVADLLGVKIAAFRRTQDGYQKDVATGAKYGNTDLLGARAEVRLTPGDWVLSLRGDYTRDEGVGPRAEPVLGMGVRPGRDTIASNILQPRKTENAGFSLTANREFAFGQLTSITAWRNQRTTLTIDDDFQVVAPVFGTVFHRWVDRARQFSQETRLSSTSTGPFSYVVGVYYFNQVLNSDRPYAIGANPRAFANVVEIETTSYAAFVNADYMLSDKVTVTGGLRYTVDDKDLYFEQKGFAPLGYPTIPPTTDAFRDTDLSPSLSLRYQATPDIMAYATISRGFKAGGWTPDITKATTADAIQFDAEQNTNYELGLRTQFLDRRVTLNATIYQMDYKDLQVSQFLGTTAGIVITNAGQARLRGLELEALARPTNWLNLSAGGAYNDAKYTKFVAGGGADYSGQRFTNTPKYTAYISADIRAPVSSAWDFVAHGDYRYQSKVYFDDARTRTAIGPFARDGFGVVNARVGLTGSSGLEISVFGQNLTNERVLQNRVPDVLSLGIITDVYGPPRQYGVRVGYSF